MGKSSQPKVTAEELRRALTLELPDSQGFKSKFCAVAHKEIIRLSEQRLPLLNSQPGYEEERLRTKSRERFSF